MSPHAGSLNSSDVDFLDDPHPRFVALGWQRRHYSRWYASEVTLDVDAAARGFRPRSIPRAPRRSRGAGSARHYRFATSASVADYILGLIDSASLDRCGGKPAPLIMCASRSLAGVLYDTAAVYGCPITSTNGQAMGHLVTRVARALEVGQRVLYFGDWDIGGHQIEDHTRQVLTEHAYLARILLRQPGLGLWERLAVTAEQVERLSPRLKYENRYSPPQPYDSVESEALGQTEIVAVLRARLDDVCCGLPFCRTACCFTRVRCLLTT